jgi:hypothetical protein
VRIWDAASGRQIVKLNGLSEGYGVGFTDDATIVMRPHVAVGVLYTVRQSRGDVRLADGMVGMWAFGPPHDVDATPDVMHLIWSTSPYIIHPDGLVEYLAGGEETRRRRGRLRELARLRDVGAITPGDYETRKREILSEL